MTVPDNLSELLNQSQTSELETLANERREKIATDLEQLATDIRALVYSPHAVVIVLLESTGPVLAAVSKLTTRETEAAREALSDINCGSYYLAQKTVTPQELINDGHARRVKRQQDFETEEAAKLVAKPYKCEWCNFRAASVRGQKQHMTWQKSHGCIGCQIPRCMSNGGTLDYSTHYRGVLTCSACFKAARESNNLRDNSNKCEITPTSEHDV